MINAITIELIVIKPIIEGGGLEYYGMLMSTDNQHHLEINSSFDEPYNSIPFPQFKDNIECLDYVLSKMRYNQFVHQLVSNNQDSELGLTINGEYLSHHQIEDLCHKYFPQEGYQSAELSRFELQRQRRF